MLRALHALCELVLHKAPCVMLTCDNTCSVLRRGLASFEDHLYVADSRNHRIQVFSTALGNEKAPFVRALGGGQSSTRGRFNLPSGVCIANRKLYVTEVGGERV